MRTHGVSIDLQKCGNESFLFVRDIRYLLYDTIPHRPNTATGLVSVGLLSETKRRGGVVRAREMQCKFETIIAMHFASLGVSLFVAL